MGCSFVKGQGEEMRGWLPQDWPTCSDLGVWQVPSAAEVVVTVVGLAVMPGRMDQQLTHVAVAGLGQPTLYPASHRSRQQGQMQSGPRYRVHPAPIYHGFEFRDDDHLGDSAVESIAPRYPARFVDRAVADTI